MGNTKISNIIYPEEFKTSYIYVYPEYEDELMRIIEQSGRKDEFIRKYRKSLLFLNNLKINCTKQGKLFEKLKDCKDLYSIKLRGEINLRILFTFLNYKNTNIAVLIHPFIEKSTKDYEDAILLSAKRIKILKDI